MVHRWEDQGREDSRVASTMIPFVIVLYGMSLLREVVVKGILEWPRSSTGLMPL